MATKITSKLPNPEGVAAGGTATCRVPVGRRIHSLALLYNDTDQDLADFTEIRIYLNGQVFQRFSATERDVLNKLDKMQAAAGVLVMPFERQGLLTMAGIESTALNTKVKDENGLSIESMYVEIDIASGATIAASDLTLYAKESDAIMTDSAGKPAGAGVIPYIRRDSRTSSGADTDYQISDLINAGVNAPDKVALVRATFRKASGAINAIRVDRNNYTVFDRPAALNSVMLNNGKRAAQSGYFTVDTGENGLGGDVIQLFGMTDFRYRLDTSSGGSIVILSEYLGALTA